MSVQTPVHPISHATNEYYLTRQSTMESNVRSYPRKLPLAIATACRQSGARSMLSLLSRSIMPANRVRNQV